MQCLLQVLIFIQVFCGLASPEKVLKMSSKQCQVPDTKAATPKLRANATALDCSELCVWAGADSGSCNKGGSGGSSCACVIDAYQKCEHCPVGYKCTLNCEGNGVAGSCRGGSSCCCSWASETVNVDVPSC